MPRLPLPLISDDEDLSFFSIISNLLPKISFLFIKACRKKWYVCLLDVEKDIVLHLVLNLSRQNDLAVKTSEKILDHILGNVVIYLVKKTVLFK